MFERSHDLTQSSIENNALVLPHFTSKPSNRKMSMPLLRHYAQTVFKVYVKVRKSAQFENFVSSKLTYESNFPTLNTCRKSMEAQNGLKFPPELCLGILNVRKIRIC